MRRRYHRDLWWVWPSFLALFIVVVVAIAIWWHATHKCVETQEYSCSRSYCADQDSKGTCIEWRTEEETCTRCLKWEER